LLASLDGRVEVGGDVIMVVGIDVSVIVEVGMGGCVELAKGLV
jgi:hypothetical protein